MMPLIADADSGWVSRFPPKSRADAAANSFGLYTTVMKVVKLFVQAGAAGIHIDDLYPGAKRFDGKDGEGWTIVPTNEMLKRLTAARLQLDVMG